jgi:hypothetical protein
MNLISESSVITEKHFAPQLPAHARVWIYAANRIFSLAEASQLNEKVQHFAKRWTAHDATLSADAALLYNCFLVFAVDENLVRASGCSIDSSVHFVKTLASDFQADFFNRQLLYYFNEDELCVTPLHEAASQFQLGIINEQTKVFNNLIFTKKDLIENWIKPVHQTQYLKILQSPVQKFSFKL